MADDIPKAMDAFESWLVRRVGQAVEAGEVPASLLTELQAEIDAARENPQEEGHTTAVQDIAEALEIPLEQTERGLRTLEAQSTVVRESLLRRIAEAWLEGMRRARQSESSLMAFILPDTLRFPQHYISSR